jgi:hypothetical protein
MARKQTKDWLKIEDKFYFKGLTPYTPLYYYVHYWAKAGYPRFAALDDNSYDEGTKYIKLGVTKQMEDDFRDHDLKANWAKILFFIEHYMKPYFKAFYQRHDTSRAYIDTFNSNGIDPKVLAYEMMWNIVRTCKIDEWLALDLLANDLDDLDDNELQKYRESAIARVLRRKRL